MIDATISHYRVLRKLGSGGMGVVYEAEDLKLGRRVALKFLSEELSRDRPARERFQQEARAASALNHPNICTIYEIDQQDERYFIAMELLEGNDFKHSLGGKPLEIRQVVELGIQIADALDAAHSKGIIHRDIKPANLFVTTRGQAKILDFGVAKLVPERRGDVVGASAVLTASVGLTGAVLGTLPYMSPEQARGEVLDARSDLFSFGAVLYEMAAGFPPFCGTTSAVIIDALLNREPTPAARLNPAVPLELQRVIEKALKKDRDTRFQSAAELCADLKRLKQVIESGAEAPTPATASTAAPRRTRKVSPRRIQSLAVLPMEDLSGDPAHDYFADGMTEALITDLAKIKALRVISRTSAMQYKGVRKPVPQIARELNVDAVIEGSVLRSGDRVRITAQLIHAVTDQHLWAESYERDFRDILSLQSEIARQIANEVKVTLSPQERARLGTARQVNPEAHELYLKGRYHWNKRSEEGVKKALSYFQQAIECDPTYAQGYAGLADSYTILGYYNTISPEEAYPKGKAAALKALALDDSLAEPHATLGVIKRDFEWDWAGAEEEFQRAVELNPGYADAYNWRGTLFGMLGRREEALREKARALAIDPLSLIIKADLARMFYYTRDYDRSLEQYRAALDMDPNFSPTHLWLAHVYQQKGLFEEAMSELQTGTRLSGDSTYALAKLGHGYAMAGKSDEARAVLSQLSALSKKKYVSPYDMAIVHVGLKENDQAFAWLEKAFEHRSLWLGYLKLEPQLDPLRTDPRFQELVRRVGLPE
ncbi:MAG: protein kinase [Terriglobia bacterium]